VADPLSRRALLESAGLAIAVLSTVGAARRALADDEIKEADKIKQMDAHYQRFPKGPLLPDLPAVRAAGQMQDCARADLSARLVPVLRGQGECSLTPNRVAEIASLRSQ
jgi:hypothetical protein